ncbi:MAG: hypothetical protein ABIY56_08650, partial [Dokdonella sp.]
MAIKAVESLPEVPIGSVDQAHGVSIITSKRCMLDARGGSRLCSMPDQNPISRDWLSAVRNVLTPSPGAFVVLLAKSRSPPAREQRAGEVREVGWSEIDHHLAAAPERSRQQKGIAGAQSHPVGLAWRITAGPISGPLTTMIPDQAIAIAQKADLAAPTTERLVARLHDRYRDRITGYFRIPAKPARFAEFPAGLSEPLRAALVTRGVTALYSHQRESWDALEAG